MNVRNYSLINYFTKPATLVVVSIVFMVAVDVSLWLLDQLTGVEKGVIFHQKLSVLLFNINITITGILAILILLAKGPELISSLITKGKTLAIAKYLILFSRDAALSVFVFAGIILLADLSFYSFSLFRKGENVLVKEDFDASFYARDSVQGYAPNKGKGFHFYKYAVDKSNNDTTTIWNVTYSTDTFGLRTFAHSGDNKRKFALFFGCSYTFGVGVEDHQTLPYYFYKQDTTIEPYNFAMGGYGPQNMLARLETSDLKKIVGQKDGYGFYMYLTNHEARAIGDMITYTTWGKDLPYYSYESDSLVRKGSFSENRRLISSFYSLLGYSNIVKDYNINFPGKLREEDYQFTADIIEKSYIKYQEIFGNDRFYVIIYPTSAPTTILPYLQKRGIKVIDASRLFDSMDSRYFISTYDRHPTPEAYDLVAREVFSKIK